MSKKTIFAREATGLVRDLSAFDAFNLNFAWLNILVGTLWTFSWTPVVFPGAYITVALGLVIVPLFFLGLLYSVMASAMPRSGGDYIWTSRILHPTLGLAISFYGVYFFFTQMGMLASFLAQFYLSPTFFALGRIYNSPSLTSLASSLLQPSAVVMIGTLGVLFYFLSAVAGAKVHARIQLIMFLGANIAMLVALGLLLGTQHSSAVDMINKQLAGSGYTYDSIIQLAQQNGYSLGWNYNASLAALPYAFTFYWGFYNCNWYLGEVKGGGRSMQIAIEGSLLVAAFFAVILAWATFNVFGFDFYNGLNFLYFAAPTKYPQTGVLPLPYMNYLLTLLTDNNAIILIILVGYIMNGLWQLVASVIPSTRQIFAWSFDRIIPERFSQVNERLHSPIWAVVLMAILGEVSVLLWLFTTLSLYLVNLTIGWLICNLIVAIACLIFPWRRKDTFEATVPPRWKRKIAGLPLLSWLSIIVLVPTALMIYSAATNPIIGGPISYESMFVGVFGAMIAGVVAYVLARAYRKSKGVNLDMTFAEIPPE